MNRRDFLAVSSISPLILLPKLPSPALPKPELPPVLEGDFPLKADKEYVLAGDFPTLHNALNGGFEYGTLNLVVGTPASGKTSFLNSIAKNNKSLEFENAVIVYKKPFPNDGPSGLGRIKNCLDALKLGYTTLKWKYKDFEKLPSCQINIIACQLLRKIAHENGLAIFVEKQINDRLYMKYIVDSIHSYTRPCDTVIVVKKNNKCTLPAQQFYDFYPFKKFNISLIKNHNGHLRAESDIPVNIAWQWKNEKQLAYLSIMSEEILPNNYPPAGLISEDQAITHDA